MNGDKAAALLAILGAQNIFVGERWVRSSCVFAPWTHKAGVDRNPSFGISIEEGERSYFNCFSCHKSGDLDTMMVELLHYFSTSRQGHTGLAQAFAMIEDENVFTLTEWTEGVVPKVEFEAWPEWYLEGFLSALVVPEAVEYLQERGVSKQWIEYFDVRVDMFKQRVCFPYRNSDGELAGLRGRSFVKAEISAHRPHFDYRFNGHSNIGITWFNEHHCDTSRALVVVEGQFDCAAVSRVYKNVVANLSSGASHSKLDRLQYYPEVIFFYDADKAGLEASHLAWRYLREKTTCYVVEYDADQAGLDPGQLTDGALRKLLAPFDII